MFYFEKFIVYHKARDLHCDILEFVNKNKSINKPTADQLIRASLSIVLNIAEGTGKNSKKEKKNYYTISRGSVYECVAVLQLLKKLGIIDKNKYYELYNKFEEITKILTKMMQNLDN